MEPQIAAPSMGGPPAAGNSAEASVRLRERLLSFFVPDNSSYFPRIFITGALLIAAGKLVEHVDTLVPALRWSKGLTGLAGGMIVGIGEGSVVAWLIAVTIESRLHSAFTHKLERDAGEIALRVQDSAARGMIWRLTFQSAPDVYIKSIKELAEESLFTTDARYELSFDYEPASNEEDVVRVTIVNRSFIENRGKKTMQVSPSGWLVSSKIRKSRWIQALYECPQQAFHIDYIRQEQAETRPDPNGYARFRAREDAKRLHLEPGNSARIELVGEVWRSVSSSLPLFNKRPTLRASLVIRGDAVKDLDFRIIPRGVAPSEAVREEIVIKGNSPPEEREILLNEVFLVGQNIEVIWWRGAQQLDS